MQQTPRVSVIIPAHNAAATIIPAIDSVLRQEGVIAEIVVIDDGSTDSTADVVANHNSQIRIIRQACLGVSNARNSGLAIATGKYIAFLDADDEWLPHKLSTQLERMEANPDVGISATAALIVGPRGEMKAIANAGSERLTLDDFLFANPIVTSTVVVRSDVFKRFDIRFSPDISVGEDWDLWTRIAARTEVDFVCKVCAVYTLYPFSKRPLKQIFANMDAVYTSFESDMAIRKQTEQIGKVIEANRTMVKANFEYLGGQGWAARRRLLSHVRVVFTWPKFKMAIRILMLPLRVYELCSSIQAERFARTNSLRYRDIHALH